MPMLRLVKFRRALTLNDDTTHYLAIAVSEKAAHSDLKAFW
jgi:hypothetical protein